LIAKKITMPKQLPHAHCSKAGAATQETLIGLIAFTFVKYLFDSYNLLLMKVQGRTQQSCYTYKSWE
jgi:hypothetical protein